MPTFNDYFLDKPDASGRNLTGIGLPRAKSVPVFVRDLRKALATATGLRWSPQQQTDKAQYIAQLVMSARSSKKPTEIAPADFYTFLFRAQGMLVPAGRPFEVDFESRAAGRQGIKGEFLERFQVDPSRETPESFARKVADMVRKADRFIEQKAIPFEPWHQASATRVAHRFLERR